MPIWIFSSPVRALGLAARPGSRGDLHRLHVAGEEQVVLVMDVAVERGLRDAEPLGDIVERGAVTAAAIEDAGGLADDRFALGSDCSARSAPRSPTCP